MKRSAVPKQARFWRFWRKETIVFVESLYSSLGRKTKLGKIDSGDSNKWAFENNYLRRRMISPHTIQQITNRIDVMDVVGEFVKLKKRGTNYLGLCPFHNEKTPSFFISTERGTYYCFGCGEKGDIFSFVEKFEGAVWGFR